MNRTTRSLIVLVWLASVGCQPSQPVASPARSASPPPPAPPAAQPIANPAASQAAQPEPTPPRLAAKRPRIRPPEEIVKELMPRLIESDGQGGWTVNEQAEAELKAMGPPGRLVLLVMLQNRNVELRRRAANYWLTRFDPDDPEIVSGMAFMLDDDDLAIRRVALAAIQKAPADYHRNYVEKLAAMLDREVEDNPETRLTICRMVGKLQQEGRRAFIPLMTAVQRDPDARVRAGALEAALLVGRSPEIFEPLAFGMTDTEPAVRLIAARSLRDLGREAEGAEQGLAEALSDSEPGVREAAAAALVSIGQRSAQPLILKLGAPNAELKIVALDCLAKIGPAAREAIPALEHCTRDRDPEVRKHATNALAAIKGP